MLAVPRWAEWARLPKLHSVVRTLVMMARVVLWWLEDPERADRDALVETVSRIQLHGTHPA